MKTNGGFLVTKIKQLGDRIFEKILSEKNIDAQARRLGIRVKGADGKTYLAHTLNNTCVAPPRMLIAFLENHLQKDGTVTIPKCLQPYMGGKEVLVPKHK